MIRLICMLILFAGCNHSTSTAQVTNMKDYDGDWGGDIHPRALSHDIVLEKLGASKWHITMANDQLFLDATYTSETNKGIQIQLDDQASLRGEFWKDGNLSVFINSKGYEYHILFTKSGDNTYSGRWNTFYVDELLPSKLYLNIEGGNGNDYQAWPMITDNRFRGAYPGNFKKSANTITFYDQNAGYTFIGELYKDRIELGLYLFGTKVTNVSLERELSNLSFVTTAQSKLVAPPSQPKDLNDGLSTATLSSVSSTDESLKSMVDSISTNALTNVHSVLVSKGGNLVYENYFNGWHANLAHDQRSAAKSIGSAIVGIAMEEGIFDNVDQSIYDYIPGDYQYTKDEKKSKITIKHLLTMSSGMDAIDFGIDRIGKATEDVYQTSGDWLKTVLEAPMIFEPGAHCNYGSANPYLLSVGLANKMDESLLSYMQRKLFTPLGFSNYSISKDDDGNPYFGGGFYFIPRDMMKFGELYRNRGVWKGQRLISQQWVNDSFKEYAVLENTDEKNGYGYLWWHKTYEVNGQQIKSVEARGAGGQYIAIIDELDMTIVITSGNYRNGRYWQPDMMIEDYILPAFVK